jgi:predicted homoserine dehydrogenase-like protein
MKPLKQRLLELKEDMKIAVTGIGSIGNGLVFQSHHTPGIKPVGIADILIERAEGCAKWLNLDYRIVKNSDELNDAIRSNKVAVTDSGELLASTDLIDVHVESSNAIIEGAKHAETALNHGQHVVMMNYEAELLYGPYLLKKANEKGLVYTCADGDQPTVIKGLVDEIEAWGFELVMGGNIKGFLDRYTDPIKIAPEADKRSLDHKMCSSYTDGTKLCVEMAVLANALNLRTHIPGMYGPRIKSVYDIFDVYDFQNIYKNKQPVVDYIVGAEPKGGVFVIGYTEDKFQQYTLEWFPPNMGPGPFYLFYRPYHLGHIEAMACIAEAYLDGTARLQPTYGMKTNVFCYAKKDLKAGEFLDGMGGFASYGLIENLEDQNEEGLPICLAENIKLQRDIKKDERISMSDVVIDRNDPSFSLYFEALKI